MRNQEQNETRCSAVRWAHLFDPPWRAEHKWLPTSPHFHLKLFLGENLNTKVHDLGVH